MTAGLYRCSYPDVTFNEYVTRPPKSTDTFKACSINDGSFWTRDNSDPNPLNYSYSYKGATNQVMSPIVDNFIKHLGVTEAQVAQINKKASKDLLLWFRDVSNNFSFAFPRTNEILNVTGISMPDVKLMGWMEAV